jgi:hypothetical protein
LANYLRGKGLGHFIDQEQKLGNVQLAGDFHGDGGALVVL